MYGVPSHSERSKIATMFGCVSPAAACASRRKRSRNSGSSAKRPPISFSATRRPSTSSSAHQTSAIPPEPSRFSAR